MIYVICERSLKFSERVYKLNNIYQILPHILQISMKFIFYKIILNLQKAGINGSLCYCFVKVKKHAVYKMI